MTEMKLETVQLEEEAANKTEWEKQRLDYYQGLRYNFLAYTVDDWLDSLYEQQKAVYTPEKYPSWNQIRKRAGIGLIENAVALISKERRKELESKKAPVQQQMKNEIDRINSSEQERCNQFNMQLKKRLQSKYQRFIERNSDVIEEYFMFALDSDSFLLDGNDFLKEFNLIFDSSRSQLIIDYKLPRMDQVSQIKEWKLDKNNAIIPKTMNKTDYLEMYERILFDISLRVTGVVFQSDSNNVLNSIVFNGCCIYNNWQEKPTVLISFEMPKNLYSYEKTRKMDCISKAVIAKSKEVRYIDNINSQKPSAYLWETPPLKMVVPIRSTI